MGSAAIPPQSARCIGGTIPEKLRLDAHRSIEVNINRLSPRIGCGLMLATLPRFESVDALNNIMNNYGYNRIHADKPAQKTLSNSALLKQFYDNAFINKTPLQQNFRSTYGHLEIYLAFDPAAKTAWFISDPQNKIALVNYYRDAVSLGLKADGILLIGSTPKLTPLGWQNLHDLLTPEFFQKYGPIERVEIMSLLSGARLRPPSLGLGVTLLNLKDLKDIRAAVEAAARGENSM
ncbi:hypothetical protein HPY86_08460 [candidate division WOR-3 bacterium]|nr:hypothetical protein [candidate division WOR-3 bacterium]